MDNSIERKICPKCQQNLPIDNYFKSVRYKSMSKPLIKSIYYTKECKQCIYSQIDNDNRETFDKYLKELDIPYIGKDWNKYKINFPNRPIFGRYVSLMNLMSFKCFTYDDTEFLNDDGQFYFSDNSVL